MKIAVYTIAKNEEKFAVRWADSCKEADYRVVVDTGSTDNTVDLLRQLGVITHKVEIKPWRFDIARNVAIECVPEDVDWCIVLDMDEVLQPGWRQELEEGLKDNDQITRVRPWYVWSFKDGKPDIQFAGERIHKRDCYRWKHPVHESLECLTPDLERSAWLPNIQIHHYPDNDKPRSQYLPLLELAVEEEPNDPRMAFYYARELMYHDRCAEAIVQFQRYLDLPNAIFLEERIAAMRFTAKCYESEKCFNNYGMARHWHLKAVACVPTLREAWYDFAEFCMRQEDWHAGAWAVQQALKHTRPNQSYLSEAKAWNQDLYTVGVVCAWNVEDYKLARQWAELAYHMAPKDRVVASNYEFFKDVA